jgi:hypothetical protein
MSAAIDLQLAIARKLASRCITMVGDGEATEFTIAHGFGTRALYATVKAGDVTLVNGTDFAVAFTDADTIVLTALGGAPTTDAWSVKLTLLRLDASLVGEGYIEGTLPIVPFKTKDQALLAEGAAAARELALYIMPPLPTRAVQGVPFVFWERVEVRVMIVEQPQLNTMGADAYDLVDDVSSALHWQPFSDRLAHPLQLAESPAEMIWEPAPRLGGLAANARMIDVIFEATHGLQPATAGTI